MFKIRPFLQIPNTGTTLRTKTHNILKYSRFPLPRRLIHNHPSGDPTPSRADIDMTKTIIASAKPLGISVHDHIIIGKKGHASMKGLLLI